MRPLGIFFLAILLWAGSIPALAQGWAGSVTVGDREVVRHADGAFQMEYYYTVAGHAPSRAKGDVPYFASETNAAEWEVPNHPPGCRTGKCWVLVKFMPRNTGEIKSEHVECSAIDLPFASDLGGYLIDLSMMPPGVHAIGSTVKHMGGENVMQIVIFLFRSQREVQDQFGFWLHVSDPDLAYPAEVVRMVNYMRGLPPTNGEKARVLATRDEPRFIVAPPNTCADTQNCQLQLAELTVHVSVDATRSLPGSTTFYLQSLDNQVITAPQAGSRLLFQVPPGKYRLYINSKKGEARRWEIFPAPPDYVFSFQGGEKIEVSASRREK